MLTHVEAPASGENVEHVLWEGPDSWDDLHNGPSYNFVAAIRTGSPLQTTLENSLVVATITDAIYEFCRNGTTGNHRLIFWSFSGGYYATNRHCRFR